MKYTVFQVKAVEVTLASTSAASASPSSSKETSSTGTRRTAPTQTTTRDRVKAATASAPFATRTEMDDNVRFWYNLRMAYALACRLTALERFTVRERWNWARSCLENAVSDNSTPVQVTTRLEQELIGHAVALPKV